MTASALLGKLDGVRKTGPDRWVALCPNHEDRSPSLAVRETADGLVLVHCFAGCSALDVLAAVGLTFSDIYPDRLPDHRYPRQSRTFHAGDILECVAIEALTVAVCAGTLAQGGSLSELSLARLHVAAGRLLHAAEVACHA